MLSYATITIGARNQYVVKVSWEDYDFLMQWTWTNAVSHKGGGLVYARRSERIDGQNVTILMQRGDHHPVHGTEAAVQKALRRPLEPRQPRQSAACR